MEPQGPRSVERRGMVRSIFASVVIGVVALLWGVIAESRVLLFDGAFVIVGIALSGLSIAASTTAAAPPTRRFPFGRPAATPLVIAFQGAAMLGMLLFAAVDAVLVIRAGGTDVAPRTVALYGSFSGAASLLVALWLGRLGRGGTSEILEAEAAQWRASGVLSAVVVLGGVVALVLDGHDGWQGAVAYVDPVLVLIASALVTPTALGMLRTAGLELLQARPPAPIQDEIDRSIEQVRAEHRLPAPTVAATKIGQQLFVSVTFLIEGDRTVAEEDAVRRALIGRLETVGLDVWAHVELTADSSLLE